MATQAPTPVRNSPTHFKSLLLEHICAGYQMLYIPTSEEHRVEFEINDVARTMSYKVVYWDNFEGFTGDACPRKLRDQKFRDPYTALSVFADQDRELDKHLFVFRDLDDFWQLRPDIRRAIRSLCSSNRLVDTSCRHPIIVLSPQLSIHFKLKTQITTVDFALPDVAALTDVFADVQESAVRSSNAEQAACSEDLREKIVLGLRGLTVTEAENCLSRCLVRHKAFNENMITTIKEEKSNIVRKSEVLVYVDESDIPERSEIGGFDAYLEFIDRRKLAYTRQAREARIDNPKGVVLLGVPGSAKSVAALMTGKVLGLPVVTLDVGAIFNALVGESESRLREALKMITAFNGCVLLIDEADKGFGGAASSSGDSGVTRRVFGQLLSWLAAKQDRTFVIMTLNRTDGIPPEFLRAGRFDAVFFTDLPQPADRETIIKIHLRKRGVNPDEMGLRVEDWRALIDATDKFVGSELEELVREARYIAFEQRQTGTPIFEDLMTARGNITPLAQLDPEGVNAIRKFCTERALRPVSQVVKRPRPRGRNLTLDN